MYFAKERRSGKIVNASEASPARYYICPTCLADVILRRGQWRTEHFAHRSGQGKPDCENYHPSQDLTYSWPSHGDPAPGTTNKTIDPLLLSIELQPESTVRGKKLRKWELRLTVPKSEDTHGRIIIDCGAGLKRPFSLSKLALGSQTCSADVDAEDFGTIWFSPEVRGEYRSVLEERIPGLHREQATLFASSASRLKPRVDRASWGDSYYLVWHTAHAISVPRSLAPQPLAPIGQWNCALIALPEEEDDEIRTWIKETTAVAISPQRRVFGLLYPPPCGQDILGRVVMPAADEIVFGLKEVQSETVTLRATVGETSSQVSLHGAGRHLVGVGDANRAHIALWLNEAQLPQFIPTSIGADNFFPEIRIVIREVSNPGHVEASLGSKKGLSILQKVREGQAEIFKWAIPSGVKGAIRWKSINDLLWSTMPLGSDGTSPYVIAGAAQLAQFNAVLQDRAVELEIDFGAFGIFRASREKSAKRASDFVVPRVVRDRIRWLATASASATNRNMSLSELSDADVVRFVLRMRVSPHLAAHHRALVSELRRLADRSTVK